jgi:hypothetical protein
VAILKSSLTPEYAFNSNAARYIDVKSGRFVPANTVRDAINQVITKTETSFKEAAQKLVDRQSSVKEFQATMTGNIKTLALATSIAAKGGFANMTPADYGRVGAEVKQQYQFLQNFCNELANGKQGLDGRVVTRAAMYAQASWAISQEIARRNLEDSAREIEEKRVLGIADHCRNCLDDAAAGWQPLGTLPKIGNSLCRVRCRCHFEFRKAA